MKANTSRWQAAAPAAAWLTLVLLALSAQQVLAGPTDGAAPPSNRAAEAAQAMPRPALWRVRLNGGGSAWLFGTLPYARPGETTLPAYVQRALAGSEGLASEVRMPPDKLAAARLIVGMRQEGASFKGGLDPERSRRYQVLCSERRLPCEQLDAMPAFFTLGALSKLLAVQQGLNPETGSLHAVHQALKDKPFLELEGMEASMSLLRELPATDQLALLDRLLERQGADGVASYEAWLRGDVAGMQQQLSETAFSPATHERLLTQRHRQWRDKLVGLLREGRRLFIAVGAGHLGGSDGLDALLKAEGFEIERVDG
ncbi:TraB/GumN family protein [Roseateles microcysteis]|uniref:TraB/GumN family protein n=1 Tax=Roseateles microcysteis TaxID=3119057 RepID=UPI002FE5DF22